MCAELLCLCVHVCGDQRPSSGVFPKTQAVVSDQSTTKGAELHRLKKTAAGPSFPEVSPMAATVHCPAGAVQNDGSCQNGVTTTSEPAAVPEAAGAVRDGAPLPSPLQRELPLR